MNLRNRVFISPLLMLFCCALSCSKTNTKAEPSGVDSAVSSAPVVQESMSTHKGEHFSFRFPKEWQAEAGPMGITLFKASWSRCKASLVCSMQNPSAFGEVAELANSSIEDLLKNEHDSFGDIGKVTISKVTTIGDNEACIFEQHMEAQDDMPAYMERHYTFKKGPLVALFLFSSPEDCASEFMQEAEALVQTVELH